MQMEGILLEVAMSWPLPHRRLLQLSRPEQKTLETPRSVLVAMLRLIRIAGKQYVHHDATAAHTTLGH